MEEEMEIMERDFFPVGARCEVLQDSIQRVPHFHPPNSNGKDKIHQRTGLGLKLVKKNIFFLNKESYMRAYDHKKAKKLGVIPEIQL